LSYNLFFCFAQTENEYSVTDSTLILGIIHDGYVCKNISSNCFCHSYSNFSDATIVVVSGIATCKRISSEELGNFFEIIHKNKTYFVSKEKLKFARDIDYFSEISRFPPDKSELFRKNAQFYANYYHSQKLDEVLKFLGNCKTKGIAILKWNIYDESEYTDGTGFKVEFYNPTKKL
jgi:hypothetical protein